MENYVGELSWRTILENHLLVGDYLAGDQLAEITFLRSLGWDSLADITWLISPGWRTTRYWFWENSVKHLYRENPIAESYLWTYPWRPPLRIHFERFLWELFCMGSPKAILPLRTLVDVSLWELPLRTHNMRLWRLHEHTQKNNKTKQNMQTRRRKLLSCLATRANAALKSIRFEPERQMSQT